MPPKRKAPENKDKATKKSKPDSSELVKWASLKITVTTMNEFDDTKMCGTYKDWNDAKFKEKQGEIECYHDGSECDMYFRFNYVGTPLTVDKMVDVAWDVYSKHHANYNYCNLYICTDTKLYVYEWYVFRFRNLGIMRTMDDVKKHFNYMYLPGLIEMHKESKEISMVKMAGKNRPFRKKIDTYTFDTLHELERVHACFNFANGPEAFEEEVESKIKTMKEEKALQTISEFASRPGHLLAKRAVDRCKNVVH